MESLGGVFIATLFGLGLAMLTLVGEVIYHRRLKKQQSNIVNSITPIDVTGLSTPPALSAKVHPSPPPYAESIKTLAYPGEKTVTIGKTFVPASKKFSNNNNNNNKKFTLEQLFTNKSSVTEYLE